ncbi:RNA-binding protein 44 [Sorex fumeus]|uniref:RNA-binding protein 44 n=1 Tax=Sorex fumeus TaxID=62283 RepID=UPI0024ACFD7D|nr:RNA-binding protein 44 [Sorex fumeus]
MPRVWRRRGRGRGRGRGQQQQQQLDSGVTAAGAGAGAGRGEAALREGRGGFPGRRGRELAFQNLPVSLPRRRRRLRVRGSGAAVVEMDSSKGNHSNGGTLQKYEPSNTKKENLLSSSHCIEAKMNFLDDWDSMAAEQRANNKNLNRIDPKDLGEPSFTVSPDNTGSAHSQSCAFEDSLDYAFLNETYSILYSRTEQNNERINQLNAEIESEMKRREKYLLDILGQHGIKSFDLEEVYNISSDRKKPAEDLPNCDIDEDSQQEYHSAEEQEYRSDHSSFHQAKTANPEAVELRNLGSAIKSANNPEDTHAKFESSSRISLDSIEACEQEGSAHVSTSQDSVMSKESPESKHEKGKEKEKSLMYHTIFDECLLKCSPLEKQESQSKSGFLKPEKTLKTKIHTGTAKSQIPESKDSCGSAVVNNRIMQHCGNPSTLAQGKAFKTLPHPYRGGQTSWASLFDEPLLAAYGCLPYKSLQNKPSQTLDFSATRPKIPAVNNEAVEENSLGVGNGSTSKKACFHSVGGKCPESVTDAKRDMLTVTQMVDVTTDFRACFTTSRATSTRSSVVSTSSNTEITMTDKKRPGEWQHEMQRSVACNTDWSCSQDNEDSQMPMTRGSLGKSLSVDSLKHSGNFLNKTSLELRQACDHTDLKKHPEGEFELAHEMEEDLTSKCCQKIMQRAVTAELHLLNVHYQMCHHHCSDIYQLVMQNRKVLNMDLLNNSTKKEVGAALLSVSGDLKDRYTSLKEKIKGGVPLEALPPLALETKLLAAFSCFASMLMKEDTPVFLGPDSELDHQSTNDVDISSNLKETFSKMSVATDSSNAVQNGSPNNDFKTGEVDVDLSQLKLDDKGCKNDKVLGEGWFDARENLTGADFSAIQENQTEQDKGDLKVTQEMKDVEPLRRDKGYLIHVGGLCPSVSEADLRAHFQKYQVGEISIYDSSTDYRYASLTFQKSSDAKTAVKEMNGTEINGKLVNVRLVKTPGDYTSPLSSKTGNRVSGNNLGKNTGKETNPIPSVSRLAKTRPRRLGSEQDSELFPLEQGLKKNRKQLESARVLPDVPVQLIPPNTLNLRSFTKIVNRLTELHPQMSRDHIIDALQEVRTNRKGFLNGLSINAIVEMTSSVLKNSPSS